MRLKVSHSTVYRYGELVTLSHNQLRLTPRNHETQIRRNSFVSIEPFTSELKTWIDAFGNEVTYFTFERPYSEMAIDLQADVEVFPRSSPIDHALGWEEAAAILRHPSDPASLEASMYTFVSPHIQRDDAVTQYARPSFAPGRRLSEVVRDLTSRIHRDFRYDPQATTVNTTLRELLSLRRGVCQDFAHLQIACLRAFGISARYVSGYLMTHPPLGKPKLVGADASHAWIAAFHPGFGWCDYDPTNDCLPGEEHVTLAWGRDYSDVAPIKGLYLGGGSSSLTVAVDVGATT